MTKNRVSKSVLHSAAIAAILLLLPVVILPGIIKAEDSPAAAGKTDIQQARDIKLQRIAVTWYNQPLELSLKTGDSESGRLMVFEQGEFRLKTSNGIKNIPSGLVTSVTLKKQSKDLLLIGLTAVGGAGLLSAATSLSTDGDPGKVAIGAAIGGIAGGALGWKFFYQDITIPIQ